MKTRFHQVMSLFPFVCLLLLLCLPLHAAAAEEKEPRGFETQEACAKAVVEALRSGETEAFLACYAIDETARNFNLNVFFEKVGGFVLGNTLLPPSNSWNIASNRAKLENGLLFRLPLSGLLLSNTDTDFNLLFKVFNKGDNTAAERLAALENPCNAFSGLEFQSLVDPSTLHWGYAEAFEEQSWKLEAFGMKEWEEKVLEMKREGRTVYMALDFVRYDGGWLLMPSGSVIGAIMNVPLGLLLVEEGFFTK